MVLGSEIECPSCRQSDGTLPVSMLVNQIKQDMTPQQVDALTNALNKGVAREWNGNPKNESWAQLAKQLQPPTKPEVSSLARMTGSIADSGVSYFVGFAIIMVSIVLFGQYSFQVGNVSVPILCVVWVLILVGVWRLLISIRDAKRNLDPKITDWSAKMSKWNGLYYCVREDGVFKPGTSRVVPVNGMSELIK